MVNDALHGVVWTSQRLLVDRTLKKLKLRQICRSSKLLELSPGVGHLRNKFSPKDFGVRAARLLEHGSSTWRKNRMQIRVGHGLDLLLEASPLRRGDSTKHLVKAQGQSVLRLDPFSNVQQSAGYLESFYF